VCALAALAAGCSDSGGGPGKDVVVGVLAPLSGPHAAEGREIVDGAKLAASKTNVRGGIVGSPVRVVAVDTRCTAEGARKAAAKLLAEDDLAGVLGGACAPEARAAARALGPRKVPFLVTGVGSPSILDPAKAPSTYLLVGTPYQESLAVAHWLALEGKQRLATVFEGTPADRYLTRQLSYLSSPLPKLVSEQTVRRGSAPGQVARTALVSKPDVVWFAGSPQASGRLAAALRAAGFKGTFVASSRSRSPAFLAAAGRKGAEGAYVVSPARPADLLDTGDWAREYRRIYARAPGTAALQSYDALRVLGQAVTQSGKVDHALNTSQLPGIDFQFHTFLGNVQFARDHTIQEDNHIILVVDRGRFATENTLRSGG
jgi:branched-chain amino acid transport system substrate-binding protein